MILGDTVLGLRLIRTLGSALIQYKEISAGEKIEPVGTDRQRLTLVLSSEDGCRVKIEQQGMAK
jgi:hypothetical protein